MRASHECNICKRISLLSNHWFPKTFRRSSIYFLTVALLALLALAIHICWCRLQQCRVGKVTGTEWISSDDERVADHSDTGRRQFFSGGVFACTVMDVVSLSSIRKSSMLVVTGKSGNTNPWAVPCTIQIHPRCLACLCWSLCWWLPYWNASRLWRRYCLPLRLYACLCQNKLERICPWLWQRRCWCAWQGEKCSGLLRFQRSLLLPCIQSSVEVLICCRAKKPIQHKVGRSFS